MVETERRVLVAVIDRRQRMDRWIVYLGMAIMLAFLSLLYCASHTHYSPCAPGPFISPNFREDDDEKLDS